MSKLVTTELLKTVQEAAKNYVDDGWMAVVNALISGEINAPMATGDGTALATQSGTSIYALRKL